VRTTTTGEEVRVSEHLDEEMAADFVATTIRALAKRGQFVIVGRGGQPILRDQPGVLHVRVTARAEDRLRRTQEVESLPRGKASKLIALVCSAALLQLNRSLALNRCW
jgi:hypothetical protein